jgi:hypothetical protein
MEDKRRDVELQKDVSFDWIDNIMASEEHRKDFYSLLGPMAFMFKQ